MSVRPPIPPEIKREVRQRCGFGCVICGLPIYEYEHMLEWAVVQRHVADEITLLCRQHHGEKTNGLLPKENVLAANLNPFNKQLGVSKNYLLHYSGDSVKVKFGDSVFSFEGMPEGFAFAPLVIDGSAVIMFKRDQGNLFLSFAACDELNKVVLEILDNEIVYDAGQWDAEWVGQSLIIREAHKKILVKIKFNPPGEVSVVKGRVLRNGVEIMIGEDYLFLTNNSSFFGGIRTINCPVGISVGYPIPECGVGIAVPNVPRYLFDRSAARRFLRECQSRKRRDHK
ncbi:trigger factor [Pseudomonas sp. LAMO17WK12:I6]|uniref:HNH endonuclease signature motif containing protein n=1 Tax=unclassified Pseudomonas TaxID=196821 RepID=UPI000BCAEE7E|nr:MULTISPECIES: HNH endonuclease signature motif containing protein [unclassified Pseudomonas]SNY42081.1 trigger factor [Pseudomonas sp. LAMO17WK12:I6]SNY43938.1 trigger factor [Pseudomonas sp. LAMO17WK12:I5]